jgi:hypothetical protein
MTDFSEVDKKITLLPESAFFLVFCSEAVFLLMKNDEKETVGHKKRTVTVLERGEKRIVPLSRPEMFDAAECLNRAMSYLLRMKRPPGPTHPFFMVFEELSSKILNSEKPDTIFLQNFLAEAHDLAELVEI